MHTRMLEEATPSQLKSFLSDSFAELKRSMPELYEQMECELYDHIYGHHFTAWKYENAVAELENKDGTSGAHWTLKQIEDYVKARGLPLGTYNLFDLAYAMNMLYSDYFGVVQDSPEMYYKMAKAFLEDRDAPEGKAFLYYKAMRK